MSIFDSISQKERDLFSKVVNQLEIAGGYYTVEQKGLLFKRNEWTFRYGNRSLTVDGIELTYMNTFYSVINCIRGWMK